MLFISILIITTLAIAACAAFFSIYGLAAIFSGIFWPVVIMGSTLEIGKLVAVSYIYRYKESISWLMKTYLMLAIVVLMLITSAGIFGFLSMGYQQDTLPLKQQEQRIELLISEKAELKEFKNERLTRRKQIDADIAALPNNYIKGRERLLVAYKTELIQLRIDIEQYTKQINDKTLKISKIKQEKLVNEVHTGPIIYISKVFDSNTDNATMWMIILIMFAFDPLAVALTIAINNAILLRKKEIGYIEPLLETVDHIISNDLPVSEVTGTSNISTADLKSAIASMQDKDLSVVDMAQRGMLEEMLNRKLVIEKIRKPDSTS